MTQTPKRNPTWTPLEITVALILNKLRIEAQLREQEHPADQKERDADGRNAQNEKGKDKGCHFLIVGRKRPALESCGQVGLISLERIRQGVSV